jgi:hypothetical protein
MTARSGTPTTSTLLKTKKPVTTGTSSQELLTQRSIIFAEQSLSTLYHRSQAIRAYKQMLDYTVVDGMPTPQVES